MFDGTATKWRDWNVVTISHAGARHDGLAGLLAKAGETEHPVINATLVNNDARGASTHLAF